tara:strand:- start:3892 stop:4623 length:732 start_codon:yes stop_codon:yes gene_type:complete
MRKTKFQIHDDKVFEGYSDNTSWNGFANPYFDEETYKQVVSYYIKKSKSDEENLEYWNEWKTDFKNAKGLLINTDSPSPLTVYGMGYGLCWHEVRKQITVSKLQHRQGRQGISYCCELRVGRTCYAFIEQEARGGDERVDWNNTEHYLFIHHWILDTQKDFLRKYDVEFIELMVELGHTKLEDSYKEKQELIKKYDLWEKLAKKQPKSYAEARKIQQKLGFFDDMVGTWTTVYVENKLAHKYN